MFINDPRLSDFKQILQKNGIQAEFAGGVLVCCNGVLAITRVREHLFNCLRKYSLGLLSSFY